jgi:phosphatidylglycerol:prolipoprotein diacylglycerol transferase
MLTYPEIDPIALQLGPLAIRWYALSYLLGIVLAWRYAIRLSKHAGRRGVEWHDWSAVNPAAGLGDRGGRSLLGMPRALDDLVWRATLGIILGGRLAYILLYNLPVYLQRPSELWAIWHGGMAFHGGLIGVIAAMIWQARVSKIGFWPLADVIAAGTPIGLLLGRIANFVNGELYGRVADPLQVPWAMVFPHDPSGLPRHPSQLYQAGGEGALLFLLLALLAWCTPALRRPGLVAGAFLAGYGVIRFGLEFFREPDSQLGLLQAGLSMGQWLCSLMVAAGAAIMTLAWRGQLAPRPL